MAPERVPVAEDEIGVTSVLLVMLRQYYELCAAAGSIPSQVE